MRAEDAYDLLMTNAPSRPGDPSGTFGFRQIDASERQGLVNQVFATVAERYDLMNDVMSGGMHRLWRADVVGMINPPRNDASFRVLDLAGGTGDMALRLVAAGGGGTRVVICDISAEMLEVGRRRVTEAGQSERIELVEGNAEALAFADQSFDVVTISFGIRNVTHIDKALREAYRVLVPGGRFVCLECSHVDVPMLDKFYDLYSFEVIPRLGALTAGASEPYRYLVESIRQFPKQERFAEMIRDAGFERVGFRNLSGGVAAIHWGWRI